jgi:hypothetical protein
MKRRSSAAVSVASPPVPSTAADVAALIVGHGYRLTGPRRAVVAAVLGKRRPFTAEAARL